MDRRWLYKVEEGIKGLPKLVQPFNLLGSQFSSIFTAYRGLQSSQVLQGEVACFFFSFFFFFSKHLYWSAVLCFLTSPMQALSFPFSEVAKSATSRQFPNLILFYVVSLLSCSIGPCGFQRRQINTCVQHTIFNQKSLIFKFCTSMFFKCVYNEHVFLPYHDYNQESLVSSNTRSMTVQKCLGLFESGSTLCIWFYVPFTLQKPAPFFFFSPYSFLMPFIW